MTLVFIIAIVSLLIIQITQPIPSNAFKNIKYHQNEHSLEVLKIDENNRYLLRSKRVPIIQNHYNPASATYTGVSVGGITTGGWDIKDAHYSNKITGTSDRYHLFCITGKDRKNDTQIIDRIDLSPNDAEVAKNNPVLAPLLNGNSLILKHQSSKYSVNSSIAKTVWEQSGDINLVQNILAKDLANQNLTEKEVAEVIDFLCGGKLKTSLLFKRLIPLYLSLFLSLVFMLYVFVTYR